MSENKFPISNLLTLNNLDVVSVDINSKENILYILAVEHKKHDGEMIGGNAIFVVDTHVKKVANKVMIQDKNLDLDKILFDANNNKLYGIGTKEIKNNDKLIRTNFIYAISFVGVNNENNKILFKNISTSTFPFESDDYDDTGIADVDINIKSGDIYLIFNNHSIIRQNSLLEQDEVDTSSHKTKDSQQIYEIPYGNEIINNPNKKLNYVLVNSIKSTDKDIILALNQSTGRVVKNYTLPTLNSRNLLIEHNKGKLYILGDYFVYNNDIKGLSKQAEMINVIDTDSNNVTHFSLGNFTVKNFILNPNDDVLYALTKGNMSSLQQKSNANHILEIDPKTERIKDIASIPLERNYIVINDISQTLFIIGQDSQEKNKILSIDVSK
jgi:hypothetical protein